MLIGDLGERGLLELIAPYCLPDTIGDDGAIVSVPAGAKLAVTTDVLVDGVHFSDRTTSAADVGWRSVAANLSDLAAMGATPLGITVGLSLPPELPVAWVEGLYQGMQACLARYGTGIIGGDLTRSSVPTVAITALGAVPADRIIARSRARVGDAIVATGYHGNSNAGLQLLLDPQLGLDLSPIDRRDLITAHQRPQPRLDVLPILERLQVKSIAGMDSSDGLADAICQICRESGVGAIVPRSTLPISPALARLFPDTASEVALYGGEDFELILCLPEAIARAFVTSLGNGAAIVGRIVASSECLLVDDLGGTPPVHLAPERSGFVHFERGKY